MASRNIVLAISATGHRTEAYNYPAGVRALSVPVCFTSPERDRTPHPPNHATHACTAAERRVCTCASFTCVGVWAYV